MKKRYVVSPLLLLVIAVTWNVALKANTPVASAEEIKQLYIAPQSSDARHPVESFVVAVSGGETESAVLAKLPTTLYPEDRTRFVVDPGFGLGTIVQVERALPVTIQDGRQTLTVRTWANTVGELLDDVNRSLAELDTATYRNDDLLKLDMTIKITRVAKSKLTTTKPEPFDTTNKNDPTLWQGETAVDVAGKQGVRTIVYEVTRKDGVEVSRVVTSSVVTTPPVTKVVRVGTKPRITRPCGGYDAMVLDAAIKNGIEPNSLCYRLMAESTGNPRAIARAGYQGLFQYDPSLWPTLSAKAGYSGASIWDAKAQIYVTAWAWANGHRSRWPTP